MASEVSVIGQLPVELHQSLLDRLATHSHGSQAFTTREVVFERGPVGAHSDDSDLLRLRIIKDSPIASLKAKTASSYILTSLGRVEPERLNPDFLIRPVVACPIKAGDPFELASAFGYRRKFEFTKRGVAFVRGSVVAEVFQVHRDATSPAVGDPNRYLVSLTALTPAPVPNGPTTQELRQDAFVALRELQRELKGLVDLARVEP